MVPTIASLAPKANGDVDEAARRAVPGQEGDGRGAREGDGRHHRREHERAPHGDARRQRRRRRRLRAQQGRATASARSACSWRSRAPATKPRAARARPPDRHARRRRRTRSRSTSPACRPRRVEREKAILRDKNQGKPAAGHREDRRQRRSRATPRSNCLLEQAFVIDPSKTVAQAVKDAEARSAVRSRSPASCATRWARASRRRRRTSPPRSPPRPARRAEA